jgi:hypothetical protein
VWRRRERGREARENLPGRAPPVEEDKHQRKGKAERERGRTEKKEG